MGDSKELVFRPGRAGKWGLIALALLFSIIGLRMIQEGKGSGWFVFGTFGLGLIVAVINGLPSAAELRLDVRGFVVRALFRRQRWEWEEVDHFCVTRIGPNRTVGFTLSARGFERRPGRHWRIAGVDGALPDTYGQDPDELARLMNDWREGVCRAAAPRRSHATLAQVRERLADSLARGQSGILALKLAALFSFCGGPLMVADALAARFGRDAAFAVAVAPVALLIFGMFALRARERDVFGRLSVLAGKIGAAMLALANLYALVRLSSGYAGADRVLIVLGVAAGTAVTILYFRSAASLS